MTKMQMIGGVLVAGLAAGVAFQTNALKGTRQENLMLRQQVEEIQGQYDELRYQADQPSESESNSSLAADQMSELLRLRSEAGRLRKLLAELGAEEPEPEVEPTVNPEEEKRAEFPKDTWAYKGYLTPKSTLQTMFWAQAHSDVKTFKESFTPEGWQAVADTQWPGKSENEIAYEIGEMTKSVTAFRTSKPFQVGYQDPDSEATFVVRIQQEDGEQALTSFTLKKIGAEWKCAGQRNMILPRRAPVSQP